MSELKIHDPNIVSEQRHPGEKGYWIKYKDGTEKFIEDEPMRNPRKQIKITTEEIKQISRDLYSNSNISLSISEIEGFYYEYERNKHKFPTADQLYNYIVNSVWGNPRKKYRELRKPARPGNYQKIMKEIDEKPNEWRFRLLPHGKFHPDSFRSKEITEGVRAITGCEKGKWSKSMQQEIGRGCKKGFTGIQALRLSKSVFKTKESAAKWIAKHTEQKYRTSTSKSTVSWKEFIKGKMSPYMKSEGSHGGAIRRMGKEWKLYKKEHGIN